MLTDSYAITIEWMPRTGEEPRMEVKEYAVRASAFSAYTTYRKRIGKDVLAVRMGDHSNEEA